MSKSFWEIVVGFFHPCIHMWRVVEKLTDNPEHPNSVTIIRECDACGEIDTQTVVGPKREVACPPHRWLTKNRVGVHRQNPIHINGKPIPYAFDYEQECERCGELRVVRLEDPK